MSLPSLCDHVSEEYLKTLYNNPKFGKNGTSLAQKIKQVIYQSEGWWLLKVEVSSSKILKPELPPMHLLMCVRTNLR